MNNKLNNENFNDLENNILDKTLDDISFILGYGPHYKDNEQAIFIIEKIFFNLFSRKLYVYLSENRVRDYYIGVI